LPAVNGDDVQLQEVLLNLVRNGCDAMADVEVVRRRLSCAPSWRKEKRYAYS